jgi:hypothetical protein
VVRPVRASLRLGWPLYLEFIKTSNNDHIKSNSTRNFVCCLFSRCAVVERSSSIYRLPLDEATGGQKPRLAGPLIGLPTLREKFLDLPRLL